MAARAYSSNWHMARGMYFFRGMRHVGALSFSRVARQTAAAWLQHAPFGEARTLRRRLNTGVYYTPAVQNLKRVAASLSLRSIGITCRRSLSSRGGAFASPPAQRCRFYHASSISCLQLTGGSMDLFMPHTSHLLLSHTGGLGQLYLLGPVAGNTDSQTLAQKEKRKRRRRRKA